MTDMEYTLDERVVRTPPADPDAALAEALRVWWYADRSLVGLDGADLDEVLQGDAEIISAALDAAGFAVVAKDGGLPSAHAVDQVVEAGDSWREGYARLAHETSAEITRLRTAIQAVLDDAESQHPGGWGPDVTTVAFLRAALAGGDDDE